MKRILLALCGLVMLAFAACSLPPEKPVSKQELFKTGIYTYYTIQESPESVLAALNRDGEVVLDAKYRDRPLYIKIMATSGGLIVNVVEK